MVILGHEYRMYSYLLYDVFPNDNILRIAILLKATTTTCAHMCICIHAYVHMHTHVGIIRIPSRWAVTLGHCANVFWLASPAKLNLVLELCFLPLQNDRIKLSLPSFHSANTDLRAGESLADGVLLLEPLIPGPIFRRPQGRQVCICYPWLCLPFSCC